MERIQRGELSWDQRGGGEGEYGVVRVVREFEVIGCRLFKVGK